MKRFDFNSQTWNETDSTFYNEMELFLHYDRQMQMEEYQKTKEEKIEIPKSLLSKIRMKRKNNI